MMDVQLIRDDESVPRSEEFVQVACWCDQDGTGTVARIERVFPEESQGTQRRRRVIVNDYPLSEEDALWLAAMFANFFGLRMLYASPGTY